MPEELHVRSAGNGELTLTADARGSSARPEYFRLSVVAERGAATATVDFYDFRFSWQRFFSEIAEQWRGWEGEKCWESVEGEVTLAAINDRAGHITLRVALAPFDPGARPGMVLPWKFEAALELEAGQLDEVVRDVQRFEKAFGPGL